MTNLKCIDCGMPVSRKETRRCYKCFPIYLSKIYKGRIDFQMENHPNWRGGKPKCLDCGVTLKSYTGKRCIECSNENQRGSGHPMWNGGHTPERERITSTKKWKELISKIWKWQEATCILCGKRKTNKNQKFHIHHIIPFAVKYQRFNPDNLVLVCIKCHRWIHSRKNKNQIYKVDGRSL